MKFITFWDQGRDCEIAIAVERIAWFRPARGQGTNITIRAGSGTETVWVRQTFETVLEKANGVGWVETVFVDEHEHSGKAE